MSRTYVFNLYHQELIRRLEEQIQEERRVFEEVQQEQRRTNEERRCKAATKLQAAFRGKLVRQWTKIEMTKKKEDEKNKREKKVAEEKMIREWEEKKKRKSEEQSHQREEAEKRRAEYERAKKQERHRLERERRHETQRADQEKEKRMREEKREEEETRVLEDVMEGTEDSEIRIVQDERRVTTEDKKEKLVEVKTLEEKKRKEVVIDEEKFMNGKQTETIKENEKTISNRMKEKITGEKMKGHDKVGREKKIEDAPIIQSERKREAKEQKEDVEANSIERIEHVVGQETDRERMTQDVEEKQTWMEEKHIEDGKDEKKNKMQEEAARGIMYQRTIMDDSNINGKIEGEVDAYRIEKEADRRDEVNRSKRQRTKDKEMVEDIIFKEEVKRDEDGMEKLKMVNGREHEQVRMGTNKHCKEKHKNIMEIFDLNNRPIKEEKKIIANSTRNIIIDDINRLEDTKKRDSVNDSEPMETIILRRSLISTNRQADQLDSFRTSHLSLINTSTHSTHNATGEPDSLQGDPVDLKENDKSSNLSIQGSESASTCLPDSADRKRFDWMMNCTPWSKLSIQNRRTRQPGGPAKKKGCRRASMRNLPPLPTEAVLRSGSWTSLKQVRPNIYMCSCVIERFIYFSFKQVASISYYDFFGSLGYVWD